MYYDGSMLLIHKGNMGHETVIVFAYVMDQNEDHLSEKTRFCSWS